MRQKTLCSATVIKIYIYIYLEVFILQSQNNVAQLLTLKNNHFSETFLQFFFFLKLHKCYILAEIDLF